MRASLALFLAGIGLFAAPGFCRADSDHCYDVSRVRCLKPFSIPDRWEDVGVPGWSQWANNEHWDHEKFVDGGTLNGVWDPGEKFFDGVDATTGGSPGKVTGAQDGQYSQEYYDPIETGYLASKDLGLELTFKPGNPSDVTVASHYYPIDLCLEDGQCTGADVYRWNIGNCNPTFYGVGDWVKTEDGNMSGPTKQGLQDLISSDPGAYWDDGCKCVRGSKFGDESPRIAYVPLYDPRIPMDEGKTSIRIVNVVGMFLQELSSNGVIVGRLIRARAADGEPTVPLAKGGAFVFDCANAGASLTGGDRTTRLGSGKPTTCVALEPIDDAFRTSDMLPAARMLLGTGDVPEIAGVLAPGRDTDRDGIEEVEACFAKGDLRRLLSAVRGQEAVPVLLQGELAQETNGRRHWSALLDLPVIAPRAEQQPNRALPAGGSAIELVTAQPGPVRVRLYDVRGRLVRTLLDDSLPAGAHRLAWDGRDDAGRPAARGIYFYRAVTPERTWAGKVVTLAP